MYANKRERFLPFEVMIAQVERLLDDEDYYVQKGVGWMRNAYRGVPVSWRWTAR